MAKKSNCINFSCRKDQAFTSFANGKMDCPDKKYDTYCKNHDCKCRNECEWCRLDGTSSPFCPKNWE